MKDETVTAHEHDWRAYPQGLIACRDCQRLPLDEIDSLKRRIEEAETALQGYGVHDRTCRADRNEQGCTCGFAELLARVGGKV